MIGRTVTACVPGYIQKRESIFKFHVATPEQHFNEKVKTQWRTESFGCRDDNNTQRSVVDERVMNFLSKSIRKINDRYVVHLIWYDDNVNLPENFAAAARRLRFLENRLSHDLRVAANYKTIDMDMEKG